MLPLETTRASISNWSDTEQAALGVAIQQGAVACAAREAEGFHGADLIGLARLCSLGQTWPKVLQAATRYIEEPDVPRPQLGEAYADQVHAHLSLKEEPEALKSVLSMMRAMPYDSTVAEASDQAIDFMELLYTADALAIAEQRQGKVLERLAHAGDPSSPGVVPVPPPFSLADLYQQGVRTAQLQQLTGDVDASVHTMAALEAALPGSLAGDERIQVDATRRRYQMLGHPLVDLSPIRSLRRPFVLPSLPAHGAVTVLLLFPDWCSQCIALARQLPESVFTVSGHEAYAYGLLAQTVAPQKPKSPAARASAAVPTFDPSLAAELLKETPTVTVPASLLETFVATTVPVLIVADAEGTVRLIQAADEAALRPGGTIDSAVGLIGRTWPVVRMEDRSQGRKPPPK